MPPPNEQIGPPQEPHPWEKWSPDQHAHFEHALKLAEGVKLYRSAGGIGVGGEYAQHHVDLARRGGLTQEEATQLARYRMWKNGMQNVPRGQRAPAETPEQVSARRDAFVKAGPEERRRMMDEDKVAIERGHEAYFDSLVGPGPKQAMPASAPVVVAQQAPPAPSGAVTPDKIEAARKLVAASRRRR